MKQTKFVWGWGFRKNRTSGFKWCFVYTLVWELKPEEVRTFVRFGGGGGREGRVSSETNFVRFAGLLWTFAMALKTVTKVHSVYILVYDQIHTSVHWELLMLLANFIIKNLHFKLSWKQADYTETTTRSKNQVNKPGSGGLNNRGVSMDDATQWLGLLILRGDFGIPRFKRSIMWSDT